LQATSTVPFIFHGVGVAVAMIAKNILRGPRRQWDCASWPTFDGVQPDFSSSWTPASLGSDRTRTVANSG
jgi:hypothetical protein